MILNLDVGRLPLPDNSIDMIFTDPPYVKALIHTYEWLANEAARVLRPGAFIAAMCGGIGLNKIMRWFDDAGLSYYFCYQIQMTGKETGIVWMNGNPNIPIATRLKHIVIYSKGSALARTATINPYVLTGADKRWHHWGQCVDSHRYWIDCFSKTGDLVLDPMCGGGTTGVACSILGRQYILGDIDRDAVATTKYRLNGGGESLSEFPLFEDLVFPTEMGG